MEDENQGSMLLGVLLGFFLNCLGVVVAFVLQGPRTVTGAIIGMVLQWIATMCAGLLLLALNAFLLQGS